MAQRPATTLKRVTKADKEPEVPAIFERLGRLMRLSRAFATEHFRPLGLGTKQAMLLKFVSHGARVSLSDFAHATDTDSAAVVRLVDSLEKKSLVTRCECPEDRRRWSIVLTDAGTAMVDKLMRLRPGIERTLLSALSPEEIRTFGALLDKVLASLETSEDTSERC